jgi:hypothetical protein
VCKHTLHNQLGRHHPDKRRYRHAHRQQGAYGTAGSRRGRAQRQQQRRHHRRQQQAATAASKQQRWKGLAGCMQGALTLLGGALEALLGLGLVHSHTAGAPWRGSGRLGETGLMSGQSGAG